VEPGLRAALERQAPTAFARASRTFAVWAARVVARDALDRSAPGAGDGDTLGVTIHELRRPLTILSSYVQLLVAGTLGELSEKSAAAVRAMAQATETMSRLVDGLSAVARLADPAHQPTLTELSAAEVITAAAAEVALEAELRSVSIDLDVDGSLLLRGDAEELVLALRNLLGNAIKHAPEGTAVSISAHGDGPAVRVLVRDLGPGFPAHEAPRLFEKYYRAAAERERGLAGSGLGLFIVTSVARRHGGTASARPLPDGGAEFELAIPRS